MLLGTQASTITSNGVTISFLEISFFAFLHVLEIRSPKKRMGNVSLMRVKIHSGDLRPGVTEQARRSVWLFCLIQPQEKKKNFTEHNTAKNIAEAMCRTIMQYFYSARVTAEVPNLMLPQHLPAAATSDRSLSAAFLMCIAAHTAHALVDSHLRTPASKSYQVLDHPKA